MSGEVEEEGGEGDEEGDKQGGIKRNNYNRIGGNNNWYNKNYEEYKTEEDADNEDENEEEKVAPITNNHIYGFMRAIAGRNISMAQIDSVEFMT